MSQNTVYAGAKCTIRYAMDATGNVHAKDFFDALPLSERRKFMAYFVRMGDIGQIRNKEQFRSEGNGIYAFKAWQRRIYCYQDAAIWYLTHGCTKKTQKADPAELHRAERIRAEDHERRRKG